MNAQVAKMADAAGLSKGQKDGTPAVQKATNKKHHRRKHSVRRGNARKIVADAIRNNPGKTGTEIALMVADKVNKNTVRTQLRKLKIDGDIVQHDMRWFSKGAQIQAA